MCLDHCKYAYSDEDLGPGSCGINPVTVQSELAHLRATKIELECLRTALISVAALLAIRAEEAE